ncbi:hypothetical protein BV898_04725 [Hypsibius exemplaris]|uniref:Uncharacterized protein n=1 Tax=Hypsibius exemplaris TaxID=2072580 RepID=A0A1W0X1B7_HYPEX|nr:hypothetical protein BV898_04725 [Hypsibius exemplaris]
MNPTFRNPTLLAFILLSATTMAVVAGKSIIRELMEPRQYAPDGTTRDAKTINRPGRGQDEFPIEQCRITHTQPNLSTKLNRLCSDCYQTYRVPNFFVQCRARCYDNIIVQGCALALYQKDLMTELADFINSEDFKVNGMTMAPPTEKNGADLILQQLTQKLEQRSAV